MFHTPQKSEKIMTCTYTDSTQHIIFSVWQVWNKVYNRAFEPFNVAFLGENPMGFQRTNYRWLIPSYTTIHPSLSQFGRKGLELLMFHWKLLFWPYLAIGEGWGFETGLKNFLLGRSTIGVIFGKIGAGAKSPCLPKKTLWLISVKTM